jgi:membrane protease YdiL (CAAX protease family)
MITNGVNALCYYAGEAGKIFWANRGTVAVVTVGSYFFPSTATTVFGGVIASRGATWIARRIDTAYGYHFADVADWLLEHAPQSVRISYVNNIQVPAIPMRSLHTYAANQGQRLYILNEITISEIVAPIVEEVIYRYTGQELLGQGMMLVGVPRSLAYMISGSIATLLFAGGHNLDPRSQEYRQTLISGIVFGVMMQYWGLPTAMLTHSGNNVALRMLRN